MQCIFCGAKDEAKPIESGKTALEQARATLEAAEQADRLAQWEHVRLTITRDGGQLELLAGDVCPKEKLTLGDVTIARK